MSHAADTAAKEAAADPQGLRRASPLRIIACGSGEGGRSALVDRLLADAPGSADAASAAAQADPRRRDTAAVGAEPAPPVGGPFAERARDIATAIAYRILPTRRGAFIIADVPGDEQSTPDLVVGASTADAALLRIDARRGVVTRTHRHAVLLSQLGVRQVIVVVDEMDLAGYAQASHDAIVADFRAFAARIGLEVTVAIPVSASSGDNVVVPSERMPWYDGPTLAAALESIELDPARARRGPLRMAVHGVGPVGADLRGIAGALVGGSVRTGDRVRALPSGRESRVARIVAADGDATHAVAGQAVTLALADELALSRGDLIVAPDEPAGVADQFESTIVWMHEEALLPGRPYLLAIGGAAVPAQVTDIKYEVNVDTLERLAAKRLTPNAIGVCNIGLERPIPFDPYAANRDTGGFILIDRLSGLTVGVGMLHFALRRAHNIHRQHVDVDKAARAQLKRQRPCVLWFTGLSGSGKSTVSNLVEKRLYALGHHTYLLDGDNVRHGLNKDLGFTAADRVENIRRIAEVAKLMVDAGLIVLTAFISPFRAERRMARALLPDGEFIEVYMDTPIEVAEARDPKGLYKKARRGELKNFTGIDSPYEPPEAAELRIETAALTAEESAERIVRTLAERGLIDHA